MEKVIIATAFHVNGTPYNTREAAERAVHVIGVRRVLNKDPMFRIHPELLKTVAEVIVDYYPDIADVISQRIEVEEPAT